MTPRSAFGPAAQRLVARLPSGLPVIAAGLDGAVLALEEAVERRRAGETFYVAPLIADPRALIAQRLGGRWIEELPGIDARYRAFDALAAGKLDEAGVEIAAADLEPIPEAERRVLRDFAMMSGALLVRSSRDVERLSRLLGRRRPHVVAAPGEAPGVPAIGHMYPEAIVVWAPYLDASALGVIAMALEYLKRPVVYVCASGRLAHARGEFITVNAARAALERAACVIDASIDDPSEAIALARLGLPVLAAATAGAAEFIDGVIEYEPWDWRTLFFAVSTAITADPPAVVRAPVPREDLQTTLQRAQPKPLEREPLVSVVIPTYNRRATLATSLERFAQSRYKNLEVIVVNDGGEDVAEVVARHPNARLITLERNMGPNAAVAAGMRVMRGEYMTTIADDDEFFPDHFTYLVGAMERSGAPIGHPTAVTRYVSFESGAQKTLANAVRHDRTTDPLHLLVGGTMFGLLYRRDVVDALGEWDSTLLPADLEYQLRAAQHHDFVHVDAVTCIWHYRVDGTSFNRDRSMADGLRAMYARYPTPSPAVQERREAELRRFESVDEETLLWRPALTLPGSELR